MGVHEGGTADRPALFFDGPKDFRAWLAENHATATELWMGLYKKHVPDRGLTWDQAVPEALCYGWIDSVAQRIDDVARRQRWTPRRPGSNWSAVNIALVEGLTKEGRMQPAGMAAFERRRADRSAIYSYETELASFTADQLAALQANPAAAAFWELATPSYQRNVQSWVASAKQAATREKRFAQFLADSAAGQLIPSQRYGTVPRWVDRAAAAARAADRSGSVGGMQQDRGRRRLEG